jgi:hypothetical protein
MFDVMRLADWFAERSVRGMLMRAAGAWVLVGLPLIAARIWWSVAAALAVFVVTLTMYMAAAVRYMHQHSDDPDLAAVNQAEARFPQGRSVSARAGV